MSTAPKSGSGVNDELVVWLRDVLDLEHSSARSLAHLRRLTSDEKLRMRVERYELQTHQQIERLVACLSEHGAAPSLIDGVTTRARNAAQWLSDTAQRDTSASALRDLVSVAHAKMSTYEILTRLATLVGDDTTLELARSIVFEERAMARFLDDFWDIAVEETLRSSGAVR
jgi:ferritin-like metal-binding protein YciE